MSEDALLELKYLINNEMGKNIV